MTRRSGGLGAVRMTGLLPIMPRFGEAPAYSRSRSLSLMKEARAPALNAARSLSSW
jgi:hypothetical protein